MPTDIRGIVPSVKTVDNVMLSIRVAYTDNNPIYWGSAVPGSLTSNEVWRIMKITYSGNDPITVEWADGNTNFDNEWDERANLSYS